MRDAAIALLLVAVGVLGHFVIGQQLRITELSAKAKAGGLESQERCAKRADWALKDGGWTKGAMTPAMAASLTTQLWSVQDIVALLR
jgi:hypothetical protein